MRNAILALCCAAAFGFAAIGDASAYERQADDATPQITENNWGGPGYHRGGWGGGGRGRGWGGGGRGWGGGCGGCWGGGY